MKINKLLIRTEIQNIIQYNRTNNITNETPKRKIDLINLNNVNKNISINSKPSNSKAKNKDFKIHYNDLTILDEMFINIDERSKKIEFQS